MRIINIIDSIEKVNFGIWNAAISTAGVLKSEYKIDAELWFPQVNDVPQIDDVLLVPLSDTSVSSLAHLMEEKGLKTEDTLIVTHGCWRYATRWGAELKKKGFKWIYVPHGMLEPWSISQKRWQKMIYFSLLEYPLSKKADYTRAVGKPECLNLQKKYGNTVLIPNGIEIGSEVDVEKPVNTRNYLFMARLHHKKGIIPLVKAWINAPQGKSDKHHLYIAGPDDGELESLQQLINETPIKNISYCGAVYQKEKQALIDQCHIYLLPSHSEGFPTSVLEAMNNQLLTVITEGCNFPEATAGGYALETETSEKAIINSLTTLYSMSNDEINTLALKAYEFVREQYSLNSISEQQVKMIKELGFLV
ncbi:glycosyltransferase [Labilibacter marinus]|uniref:glycosyltransferase n=1 Tax=Labilibacter marinus TaxID=1477105 RepID=UPI000835D20E|nr:glycosyltransferase [Labilibacter marinus]